MIKQNKINYKNPLAQNLFLLTQNEDFQKDINHLKKKHSKELGKINNSTKVILNKVGSNKLHDDIISTCEKTTFSVTPNFMIAKTLIVFLISDVNIGGLLDSIETNKEINMVVAPPDMEAKATIEGVSVKLKFSFYHSKTEILDFISKNWNEIENEKNKVQKKVSFMDKLQPFGDLERDWKILKDKTSGLSYTQLARKNNLELDTVKIIVRKLKNRIQALYSST